MNVTWQNLFHMDIEFVDKLSAALVHFIRCCEV